MRSDVNEQGVRKVNEPVGAPKPDRRHRFTDDERQKAAGARKAIAAARKAKLAAIRTDIVRLLGHEPSTLEEPLVVSICVLFCSMLTQGKAPFSQRSLKASQELAEQQLARAVRALRALRMASEGAFERTLTEAERRAEFRKQVFGEESQREERTDGEVRPL